MYSFFYHRFKKWFWFILFIVFESGAVSKYFHRPMWEVILNAGTGFVCLGVFIYLIFQKEMKEKPASPEIGQLVILFTVLGAISGATILPYMLATTGAEKLENMLNLPLAQVETITVLQVATMTFIASFLGLSLAWKVNLDAPILRARVYERKPLRFSKKWITFGILGSLIGTCIIFLLDTYVFGPFLPVLPNPPEVEFWKGLLTIFYGGIVEEVLLRLFLMTFIVWLLSKFVTSKDSIPSGFYWIAIILSSILFGLGHLPATSSLFDGLTPILVIRAIVGNGLLGIWFGYLYWRKGLEYAMIAHMAGDLFLHGILVPLLS